MELFDDSSKAYSCACRRFFRQKADDPVYLYPVKVARREMWAVLSTGEIKANKISEKTASMAVDGRYGLAEAKQQYRERMDKEDPRIPYLIKYAKGVRQQLQAQEKLDKMGRDAKSVERSHEVHSDIDQTTDPSY
jgi:hypothetical protein